MAKKRKVLNLVLGIMIGWLVSTLIRDKSMLCERQQPHLHTEQILHEEVQRSNNDSLLFVGVMTAAQYLDTRARAVYETWGAQVPGKIAFFSSAYSRSASIPLVPLPDVDDSYPPQKKSFKMLKYMYDHFIDKFEWFMRADDDVYVRMDKLEELLRSVDSRKPWFIGQTGRGNSQEFGLLSLESDENFCMGGPGVILSRETLRRMAAHIDTCLQNLYTTHEDVELGRCVRRYAGVSCTWSYEASANNRTSDIGATNHDGSGSGGGSDTSDNCACQMQVILYHNQSGEFAFTGDLKQREVHRAITLHPIKQPEHMYRLHRYVQGLQIQSAKQDMLQLHRDIANSMSHLGVSKAGLAHAQLTDDYPLFEEPSGSEKYLGDPQLLGQNVSLTRYKPKTLRDVLDWEFISKAIYSYKDFNPKRRLGSSMKEGLTDVVRETMEIINQYSKQRGRIIDFKEIFYGYFRVDPVHGVDIILDMHLTYKKYRGQKMTVPVRRHAYLQSSFTGLEIREVDVNSPPNQQQSSNPTLPLHKQFLHTVLNKLAPVISPPSIAPNHNLKLITFIMPLSGRYNIFQRFFRMYEDYCILEGEFTSLIIVLYKDKTAPEEFDKTVQLVSEMKKKHSNSDIKVLEQSGEFARGKALQIGIDSLTEDGLMFFVDVDIVFSGGSLMCIRQNTVRNVSVYFPIVYSQYRTEYSDDYRQYSLNRILNEESSGFWRQFGFGIASIYKSDFLALGGFNTSISGWGLEDVELFDTAVKTNTLRIVRSTDPGLVHVYHPVECSTDLDDKQRKMCIGTKASTFGSREYLQKLFLRNKEVLLRKNGS